MSKWLVRALFSLFVVTLAGCSARPTPDVLVPIAREPRFTDKVHMYVATTRVHGSPTDPEAYTAERSRQLNYAELTVSIPKTHRPGQIEWPDQYPADVTRQFVTTEREAIEKPAFLTHVARSAAVNGGKVLVFVHGYNTLYEESVYRFAQIVHDSGFQGTAILFSWPSRGKVGGYLSDREASTYSRDYMERLLLDLAAESSVSSINILAHSMGNFLTMETLRQAKIAGHCDFRGKLGEVVLASPDIDVNVFRTQLDVIGPTKYPLTVLVSKDDKALALSAFLAGEQRVGMVSVDDAKVIATTQKYRLRVVDLSNVTTEKGGLNHDKFAESETVLSAIGQGLADERAVRQSQGTIITVIENATKPLFNNQ